MDAGPAELVRQNSELHAALRLHRTLLDGLLGVGRAIAQRAPLQEVLEAIVDCARDMLGDELPALFLRDAVDRDLLVSAASRGLSADDARQEALPRRVGEGVAGRAVADGTLVMAGDYRASVDAMPFWMDRDLKAAMAAPISVGDEVIGSLLVSSRRRATGYSATEQDALRLLAEHAGLAIGDARTLEDMAHRAVHDQLTGLPNRALLNDRLAQALGRARREGTGVAVLLCDLDRFKSVNDSLGQAAGDELLCVTARRLRLALREVDTAARLGGDEFALLLEDLGSAREAERTAARILRHLQEPVMIAGRSVPGGASIGISYTEGGQARDLLRAADLALHRSKQTGRGRATTFAPQMEEEALDRLELETDLRQAVQRGQIELVYQPLVDLPTAAIMGFEALVRWRHPARGLLSPATFVPLAEEIGAIAEIGRWVLHAATRQAQAWRERHPGSGLESITVNLSARQLHLPGIVEDVASALAGSGLPPGCLVLELTESILVGEEEVVLGRLEALRALGVRIALDDFGTGWSSLQELLALPLDMVKVPREFVDGLAREGRSGDEAVVQAVVDLGGTLGLTVVAEGIERREQVRALRRMGCRVGQGYLFARPTSGRELSALLDAPPADAAWRLGPVDLAERGLVRLREVSSG